jgi:hypothetical protein
LAEGTYDVPVIVTAADTRVSILGDYKISVTLTPAQEAG